jgi:hypothetical protein
LTAAARAAQSAPTSQIREPLGKGVAQMTRCLHLADTTSDIAAVGCFLVCRCILQDFNRIQVQLNEVKMEKITLEDELKRARQGGHNPPRTPSRVGATRTPLGSLLVVPSLFAAMAMVAMLSYQCWLWRGLLRRCWQRQLYQWWQRWRSHSTLTSITPLTELSHPPLIPCLAQPPTFSRTCTARRRRS